MKFPQYSWLRLSEDIRVPKGRVWISLDKLPTKTSPCAALVYIGSEEGNLDLYSVVNQTKVLMPQQHKVLELFFRLASPTKKNNQFTLNYAQFCELLPYCTVLPFEIPKLGVLDFAKEPAKLSAKLNKTPESGYEITFSLLDANKSALKNPHFFGEINAHIIDENGRIYALSPSMTSKEIEAIVSSAPLPLVGLNEEESLSILLALGRMGIDFSCLDEIASDPKPKAQIALRVFLKHDPHLNETSVRMHLVTQIARGSQIDEIEIPALGSLFPFHINWLPSKALEKPLTLPELLRRPHKQEMEARDFLFKLGAGPAREHRGFSAHGAKALHILSKLNTPQELPELVFQDPNAHPDMIELPKKPILCCSWAFKKDPSQIKVSISLGSTFDKLELGFDIFEKASHNVFVANSETLLVFTDEMKETLFRLKDILNIEHPSQNKNRSIAQIALLIHALKDQIETIISEDLAQSLASFTLHAKDEDRFLPSTLQTALRPYQHDAVAWLAQIDRAGLGGLLADEMGLGKTLMVLTHIAKQKEKNRLLHPALVIAPTSVLDVWVSEAQKHIPDLKVMKWHGSDRFSRLSEIQKHDVVVTSYAILRRDVSSIFHQNQFSTLILDEAQYIRNQLTDSFKAAKAIQCRRRLALTGTPIENHVQDLYNILNCVEEGILGTPQQFQRRYATPIEQSNWDRINELRTLLSPIVLRRKKADVERELPPKIESVVRCKMTPTQQAIYDSFLIKIAHSLFQSPLKASDPEANFSMLAALTRLRQICCHPDLLPGTEAKKTDSGKLHGLHQLLVECLDMGRKIIIYSQFIKMQGHIVELSKSLGHPDTLWLHGSTQNREDVIRRFQSPHGPRIIVVSLKAGGTGVTLTEADTVIFADPWWNPAIEDQASDRAHRIGQKKTVHVIRLIAENTIEEQVLSLAQRKREAAKQVLSKGHLPPPYSLSMDEIRSLLLRETDRLNKGEKSHDHLLELGDIEMED